MKTDVRILLLLMPALFLLSLLEMGLGCGWLLFCSFLTLLAWASLTDLRCRIIPDAVPVLTAVLAAISVFLRLPPSGESRLLGALFCFGFLSALSFLTRGGIGGGDCKLMGAAGLLLGAQVSIPALFLAYLLAALWYLPLLLRGKAGAHTAAPMAPFFAAALFVYRLWGRAALDSYLSLFS